MTSTSAAGQVLLQEFRSRPLESDPEYLGGAPTRPKYFVPNLCRSATLPPQAFKIKNKEAKRAFLRIYNGDFMARWSSSQDSFHLCVESTDSHARPELKGVLMETTLKKTMGRVTFVGGGSSSMFSDAIRMEDKHTLALRANHHFLRQHAGSRLSTELFVLTCTSLATYMVGNEEAPRIGGETPGIEEVQKLSVLLIDVLSTLEVTKDTNLHVGKMGESLEAIDKFVEAAKVYERLIQAGEEGRGPGQGQGATLWVNAALAYKRANRFDMAEEYYLRAFQALFEESHNNRLRLDDETHVGFIMSNLIMLYEHRRISQPERRMTSQGPRNAEALTTPVLLGLLCQVGYEDPHPYSTTMIEEWGSTALQVFKDHLKTKRAAHDALYHAFTRPTLAEYRSYLRSCLAIGPGQEIAFDFTGGPSVPVNDYKSETFNQAFGDPSERAIKFVKCSGCRKMECDDISGGRFKKCPCACVYYCDQKCQRSDWTQHKLTCSHHQKTKKKKSTSKHVS
jgi:hypothetical protein